MGPRTGSRGTALIPLVVSLLLLLNILHTQMLILLERNTAILLVAALSIAAAILVSSLRSMETCYRIVSAKYAPPSLLLNDTARLAHLLRSLSRYSCVKRVRAYTGEDLSMYLCVLHSCRAKEVDQIERVVEQNGLRSIVVIDKISTSSVSCRSRRARSINELAELVREIVSSSNGEPVVVIDFRTSISSISPDILRRENLYYYDLSDIILYGERLEKARQVLDSLRKQLDGKRVFLVLLDPQNISSRELLSLASTLKPFRCIILYVGN